MMIEICIAQNEGFLIAFRYRFVTILLATKARFPSSAQKWPDNGRFLHSDEDEGDRQGNDGDTDDTHP